MFVVVLVNDQTGLFNSLIFWMSSGGMGRIIITFIVILALLFGLTFALLAVDPKNILASNSIWLLLILVIGFLLIPTIWFGRLTDVVGLAGILTILITLVVGIAGYYYGDKIITFDWDYYLNIALWILIAIIIIVPFFLSTSEQMYNFVLVVSFISLLIFVLLLLSNHKKLKENSEKCIDGKAVPNYPVESYGLIIKIVNVFQDLIRILGMTKGRKGLKR